MIRDALQAQLQKERLHQEIIEAELAKIDRAMASISLADLQQGKPISSVTEEFMPRRSYLDALQYPRKQDERNGSAVLKLWKHDPGYRPSESSSNGKAGQQSKLQESNGVSSILMFTISHFSSFPSTLLISFHKPSC